MSEEIKNMVLTASELAYILNLTIGTIKNKLDNYQFLKYVHRNGKNPAYAVTINPKSVYLIKKLIIAQNRPAKALICLQRFNKWLKTGVIE